VVEGNEELAESVRRGVEGGNDRVDCVVWDAVRGKYVVDYGCCFGRGGFDELCGFADGGLV
jgi:hypothetical protein